MSGSLSRKVGSSVSLLFLRKIWSNVINLVVMTLLARMLSKEDFGLLAISAVLLSFINTVGTSGLAEYLIYYDKEDRDAVTNSVFWLNLFLTIGVCVVILVASPFWANFYDAPAIQPILNLLLVSFFFEMVSMVPRTLLRKELQYKVLVKYSTVFMTVVSVGKLFCAFLGAGVYSLVLPQAIFTPILALAFFIRTGYRPAMNLGKEYYREIVGYGKHLLGARILSKLVNEGDSLIVGKFISLEALGVYNLAFQLANLITSNIVLIVNDVVLPVLSKIKGDIERLRKVFLSILEFLGFLSFPLVTTLAVFAEPFIEVVYGEKWSDSVLLLQILCLFAVGRSINSPSTLLYNAMGRPDVGLKFSLAFTPLFLLSVFIGSQFGVVGVALATSITRFGGQIYSTQLAFGLAGITSKEFFKFLLRYLGISVILFLFSSWLFDLTDFGSMIVELALVPVFIYFYVIILRILDFNRLKMVMNFIKSQRVMSRLVPFLSKALFVKL